MVFPLCCTEDTDTFKSVISTRLIKLQGLGLEERLQTEMDCKMNKKTQCQRLRLVPSWHMQRCCTSPRGPQAAQGWCKHYMTLRRQKSPLPILWPLCKVMQLPQNMSRSEQSCAELWDTEQTINRILEGKKKKKVDLRQAVRDHLIQHISSVVFSRRKSMMWLQIPCTSPENAPSSQCME